MKTIWKFPLKIRGEQDIQVPSGAQMLCVQGQESQEAESQVACIWALVDPEAKLVWMKVRTYGTGQPIPDEVLATSSYLGTYQMLGGSLVWHVFVGEHT